MTFNKFKSYKATPNESYSPPKNPYTTRTTPAKTKEDPPDAQTTDELKTNNTLLARITEMAREIKDLRLDIASLVLLIKEDFDTKFTAEEARGVYYDWKAKKEHILNRITDKINKETGQTNL